MITTDGDTIKFYGGSYITDFTEGKCIKDFTVEDPRIETFPSKKISTLDRYDTPWLTPSLPRVGKGTGAETLSALKK